VEQAAASRTAFGHGSLETAVVVIVGVLLKQQLLER